MPRFLARTAGAALIGLAVAVIYADAAVSDLFNDDVHWLQGAAAFDLRNVVHLDRYNHFYRPVIEIYFAAGRHAFGCAPLPFHLASIAIHLLNTLLLFLLARAITGQDALAGIAALLFAVQPGYVEAVAWVAAITDLLPATWFLLVLWVHTRFLQTRSRAAYAISLAAFAACLLTHETSATLLPMMLLLEWTLRREQFVEPVATGRRAALYLPFVALLAASLAIAYVVNRRSYLVQEHYYTVGPHIFSNVLNAIVALIVAKRRATTYAAIIIVSLLLLLRGRPRVRFFTVWLFIALAPASLFTWGVASRYLYVPAAGLALLLANGLVKFEELIARHSPRRYALIAAIAVTIFLAVRFALFAQQGASDFRARTTPYARLREQLLRTTPPPLPGQRVPVPASIVSEIPDLYRDAAAQAIFCTPDLHLAVH